MKKTFNIYFILSVAIGLAIAWIDARPNWDDTGITVFMILGFSALFGFLSSKNTWLIALAVCIWVPVIEVSSSGNFGSLIAFLPGFIGAYLGFFTKKLISKK